MKKLLKIDIKRKRKYVEKIIYAEESIKKLEEWLPDASKDEKSFAASAKAFQELVEALTDIFAMLIKDMNSIVKDDYSNIEKIREKKILDETEANICKEANGLRNVVIHKYNQVDEDLFVERASEFPDKIKKIINKIKGYVG